MLNTAELDKDQRALVEHAARRAAATVLPGYTDGKWAGMAGFRNCLGLGFGSAEDYAVFMAVVNVHDQRLHGVLARRYACDADTWPATVYFPGVLAA
jgi:hypothetical protein